MQPLPSDNPDPRNFRARDLGIAFGGRPGPSNAVTDVEGVTVGMATILRGDGPLVVGRGPVRTGVTALHPRGADNNDPVFSGWFALNGNGEMTGTTWVEESGFLETPILLTNTFSVGIARDTAIAWMDETGYTDESAPGIWYTYPVVAETYDGLLNDIVGQHVAASHVREALTSATSGPVREGNVGGGTGMICHGFKGGTGTASRIVDVDGRSFVLGILVQANHGTRETLTIAGVPVGKEIEDLSGTYSFEREVRERGSIIVIVATDAPLLPHQLKRLARRVPLGIGRTGGRGGNGSGDIFLAFSTANPDAHRRNGLAPLSMLPNDRIGALFGAVIEATEEAIVNAMVAAETMTGINGNTCHALPHDRLRTILRKYNRLVE
jgi:L-aminopeptidase/D-esterase-like protein